MEVGRPPVLTEVKRREICAILSQGCSRATAARYVGCHPKTINNTAERDEEFAEALRKAESSHEISHLTHINKAAKEGRNWRASAWVLERSYPNRYAQRAVGTITLDQVAQIMSQMADVILEEVSDDECRQRILERLTSLTDPGDQETTGESP